MVGGDYGWTFGMAIEGGVTIPNINCWNSRDMKGIRDAKWMFTVYPYQNGDLTSNK
jgi:hypothetical protein